MLSNQARLQFHRKVCQYLPSLWEIEQNQSPNVRNLLFESLLDLISERCGTATENPSLSFQNRIEALNKSVIDLIYTNIQDLHYSSPWKWKITTENHLEGNNDSDLYRDFSPLIEINKPLTQLEGVLIPNILIERSMNTESFIIDQVHFENKPVGSYQTTDDNSPYTKPILQGSIFLKWFISDIRSEFIHPIRNRKGSLPHIAAVTAEPLPTRIATLALGTGDLDCVYYFALPELQTVLEENHYEDHLDLLQMMIEGRRLRDISDLPFDLAI